MIETDRIFIAKSIFLQNMNIFTKYVYIIYINM